MPASCEDAQGQRVDALGLRPGAEDLEGVPAVLPQQGLGQHAPCRVPGAHEQDADRVRAVTG